MKLRNPALSADDKKCIRLLYTSDYESHRRRNPDRVKGTCEWVLKHEKYQHCRREKGSSLLWISADPGCGKSVLASFLVDELRKEESKSTIPGSICYFFFKDDNDKQRSSIFALCALLHQLFTAHKGLIKHATKEFQTKGQKFIEEFGTLWNIFMAAVADPACGNVICVIDGLDECEATTRDYLIKSLLNFYREAEHRITNNSTSLKFIVTSRPYGALEHLHKHPTIRLKAEDETNAISLDIERVVRAKMEELGAGWGVSGKALAGLRDNLIRNSDRTFLWVSLILQLLEESAKASEAAFQQILSKMPASLDAVYEKMLQQNPHQAEARKILHIVVAAVRPLTLKEMNIALALRPGDKSMEDLSPRLEPSLDRAVKELWAFRPSHRLENLPRSSNGKRISNQHINDYPPKSGHLEAFAVPS